MNEIETQEDILRRRVMNLFSKIGVAITNGTALTLTEEEVKLFTQTSGGDLFVTCSHEQDSFNLH